MDYAPLFIYMKRNESNEWDIEGAQYDILHYKTKYVTKGQLFPKDEIETAKRPRFVINKVWHSFSKYEPPSIRILNRRNIDKITTSLFIIGILIVLAGLNAIYFIYSDKLFYNSPGTFIIQNAIFIFLLIYFIWHFDELREYNLDMWDALSSKNKKDLLKYHHLTYDKIRILWHLDKDFMITSPTTLKIRWKLHYPFRNYEKWDSFRDHIADIYQLCYPCNLNFDYDLFRFSNYNLDQTTKEQYQFNLQQMKKEVS